MSRGHRNIPRNISGTDRLYDRRRHLVTTGFDVSRLRRWAALPLRLIVGYGFIVHGYAKVMNGPDHFAASLQALGVPAPHALAWATIGFELLGGLAVLVGAYVPVISLPLGVILLVAAVTVHLPYGFSSIKLRAVTAAGPQFGPPGYETNALYLAALATLVLGGSGPLALDAWLLSLRRSGGAKSR
jgi:putative oxidoreductase